MLNKLERTTLSEQAASQLSALIEDGLHPGQTLPSEARLSEMLGVSRPVVREALKSLQGQGLVEVINGRGAVVRHLTHQTLLAYFSRAMQIKHASTVELLEVRRGIESESAYLAAMRRSPEQLLEMQSIIVQMQSCQSEPLRYADLDVQLHIVIGQASGNAVIAHLVESIREALREVSLRGLERRQASQLSRVQHLHEHLVAAIAAQDAALAIQTMTQHMNEAIASFELA